MTIYFVHNNQYADASAIAAHSLLCALAYHLNNDNYAIKHAPPVKEDPVLSCHAKNITIRGKCKKLVISVTCVREKLACP